MTMDGNRKRSTLVELEDKFHAPAEKAPVRTKVKSWLVSHFVPCSVTNYVLGIFPIVGTVRDYKFKEDLPSDVIAGLTSGVMMIPQGMAFAALSTLPPIVGLYISFFASVSYVVMGTGRQISWGCIAILSLMMANILDKYDRQFTVNYQNFTTLVNSSDSNIGVSDNEDPLSMETRIQVASGVSFLAALVVIACSRVGLSRITCLMSNSFITGFTVGLSMHVFTSQLKGIFGVSVKRFSGPASLIRTWVAVASKLPETNVATLVTSVICIVVIYLVKRFINEKFKKKLIMPVPIELIVLILGTVASYFGRFNDNFGVKIVKEVPTGFPSPRLPDVSMTKDYLGDALIIIFVAYAQTLAMAKTFGLKHGYVVDANQEMLACGVSNLMCSLFSGYIAGGSVSRSMVQDGAGGKTQIASLVAAGLVLLVIMLIGPYFYDLPMCVLAAIIVVNLKGMFLKLLTIPDLWRKSKYDCAIWVFTFVVTVVLNADMGLLVGVTFSVLLVLLRAFVASVAEVGPILETSPDASAPTEYPGPLRSVKNYPSVLTLGSIKIVQIKTPLYFINADKFTANLFATIGVNPIEIKATMRKERERMKKRGPGNSNPPPEEQIKPVSGIEKCNGTGNESTAKLNTGAGAVATEDAQLSRRKNVENGQGDEDGKVTIELQSKTPCPALSVTAVVLDMSAVSFLDLMGVDALEYVIAQLSSVDIETRLICIPEGIFSILQSSGFWKKNKDRLMVDLQDALDDIAPAWVKRSTISSSYGAVGQTLNNTRDKSESTQL